MKKAAVDLVDRVFRPRFKYSKAEVLLVHLCQKVEYTEDLLLSSARIDCEGDGRSGCYQWSAGQGTMRLASVPTDKGIILQGEKRGVGMSRGWI